jgi:hypothetical protein
MDLKLKQIYDLTIINDTLDKFVVKVDPTDSIETLKARIEE